jgi:hypothetical protein
MSASLRKSLSLDMPALAEMLRSKGRGKDTVLAHITPQEAALLKKRGGRGSRNPDTGLLEFDKGDDTGAGDMEIAYEQPTSNSSGGGGQDFGSQLNAASSGGQDAGQQLNQASAPAPQTMDYANAAAAQGGGDLTYGANGQAPDAASTPTQSPFPTDTSAGDGSNANANNNNWLSQLVSGLGGAAGLAKLAGLAGVAGVVGNQAQTAAQQGQVAGQQVGALANQTQAQSQAAQNQLSQIAQQAQQQGQTASQQVGAVIPQLQGIAQNISAYGQPLIDSGNQQMNQALSGTLTPAGQQQFNALKAQAEQGVASRGGVGAMQAGNAELNALGTLAQNQYQQGQQTYQAGAAYGVQGQSLMAQAAQLGLTQEQIQLAQNNLANQIQIGSVNTALAQNGISDGYTVQGIQMGLQADQQLASQMSSLYQSLAQIAFNNPQTSKYSPTTGQPLYNTQTGQLATA